MNRYGKLALLITLAGLSSATSAAEKKRMSLSEIISGTVHLVPGPVSRFEEFLRVSNSAIGTPDGGSSLRIDYQTWDNVLLHIELYADRQSTSEPAVIRLVLAVDERQCVVAGKLKAELDAESSLVWSPLSDDSGWSSRVDGLFLSISKRTGHCLAAIIADVVRVRVFAPTIHCLREPSGVVHITPHGH